MKTIKKYFYKTVFWLVNQYYRIKNYVFWGEFHRKHFLFQKEDNRIKIILQDHSDFVENIQNKIDGYKYKGDEKKYITNALEQALDGCTFVVISKGEKFVQFWTNHGRLDFDFPIRKGNGNAKYFYTVIGLLATMDFVRDSFVPTQFPTFTRIKPNYTYKVEDDGLVKTITGHFNKMVPEATKMTMKMFEEIYKEKKGKIEIKVG